MMRFELQCLCHCVFGQPVEKLADVLKGEAIIDVDVAERASGHARDFRLIGILNDRDAAAPLDLPEASSAIRQVSRQDYACDERAVDLSGTAKQRIDGGPGMVLSRAL